MTLRKRVCVGTPQGYRLKELHVIITDIQGSNPPVPNKEIVDIGSPFTACAEIWTRPGDDGSAVTVIGRLEATAVRDN